MDLELQVSALKAIAELADDREFALRFRAGNTTTESIVRYFAARGVDEDLAMLLALAYVAGSMHALQQTDRDLERVMRGIAGL